MHTDYRAQTSSSFNWWKFHKINKINPCEKEKKHFLILLILVRNLNLYIKNTLIKKRHMWCDERHQCLPAMHPSIGWYVLHTPASPNICLSVVPSFHSFIHSFIYSCIYSFIHLLIHLFIHSFIHSFIYSFIYWFIHSFTHSSIYSFTHSCLSSVVCIHSPIHSSIH